MESLPLFSFEYPAPSEPGETPRTETQTLRLLSTSTFRDFRRMIRTKAKLSGPFRLRCGDFCPKDGDKVSESDHSTPFIVEPSPEVIRQKGLLKLRCKETYYHVHVYMDEKIADVKEILQNQYDFSGKRLLISPANQRAFEDDDIMWDIDLGKVYTVIAEPCAPSSAAAGK
jgi:hypothetical protein